MNIPERTGRGDIVVVADRRGDFTGKPRPAVVIQSDLFAEAPSLVICPVSTTDENVPLLRLPLPPGDETGLHEPSWVAIDLISSVRRTRIGRRIGRVDDATMLAIGRALLVILGLA